MPNRETMTSLLGRYHGLAQDVDSIKHLLRGAQARLDALIAHFHINVQSNPLESLLNPTDSRVSDIVTKARFADVSGRPAKKRRRKKRT